LATAGTDPLLVEVTRGGIVESRHLVDAAIIDIDGAALATWGDVERRVFPRSACKPLQALPLVETGAADAFNLEQKRLAMACASHRSEPIHVETALAWLAQLGLSDDSLECGAHYPRNPTVLSEFVKSGAALRQAHNNCSGKHSAMLSHAVHMGEDPTGYSKPDHPVQQRVTAALASMYGLDLKDAAMGIDGCSIPTLAVPTRAMAQAMAHFANPDKQPRDRAAACHRIADAMMAEPYMVAGRDSSTTSLMAAGKGKVVAKSGAEGIFMAGLPGRGLGIALKTRDGNGRAADTALLQILEALEVLDEKAKATLKDYLNPTLYNVNKFAIGELRVVGWSDRAPF
jgi:L-asparaginase II